jgi:hypothetical protein
MIEGDFIKRGGRRKGGDVAANAFFGLVRAHHHRQRVPPHQALDPALDVGAARHRHLLVSRDGIEIRCIRRERQLDAVLAGVNRQLAQQTGDFDRAAALEHIIKRVEPFTRFGGVELGSVFGGRLSHHSILDRR